MLAAMTDTEPAGAGMPGVIRHLGHRFGSSYAASVHLRGRVTSVCARWP